MPRDLGDVLHYFIPEPEATDRSVPKASGSGLPIFAVPLGSHDLLRATFIWNLAAEVTRLGGTARVVAPTESQAVRIWPEEESRSAAVRVERVDDLSALDTAARSAAGSGSDRAGVVFACIPPLWLERTDGAASLLKHSLLFSSPDPAEMIEAYALAKHAFLSVSNPAVGLTIYGAPSVSAAERTFQRVAETARRHLGGELLSYGLLIDQLQMYRAIVERRPIGLAHPQSPAARALRDVARLLLEDCAELGHA